MARTKLLATVGVAAFSLLTFDTSAHAGWAGIVFQPSAGNAKVLRVLPTSPAAKAGLRRGDVIVNVDGRAVATRGAVTRLTSAARAGKVLRLKVKRGARTMTKLMRVGKVPGRAKLLRLFWLNQRAPNFRTNLVNRSGKLMLSSLRGKPVILYFWATWCDSCKKNIAKLKRLHKAGKKHGLVIYAMSEDKRVATARKTAAKYQLPFAVGHNKRKFVSRLFKFDKIPILIAIDRKGIVRDLLRGSSWSYGRLARAMRRIK